MATNFIQEGNVLTFTAPSGGVTSGQGVLIGDTFGIVLADADEGDECEVGTVGVYTIDKATDAMIEGEKLWWDDSAKNVTTTSASNTLAGVCVTLGGAASGDTEVDIRLNGSF